MKRTVFATSLGLALLATAQTASAQTSGYTQYSNTYTVQNRTSGCGGYSGSSSGTFTAWVCAGEERVEMRWAGWPNQNVYNQWQGDINFDSATRNTCIMQIKSNTGGEPIYIQVQNPGTLRNDNTSVFMSGMSGTWFRLNALFNPANGDSRAYINGSLQVTRQYNTSSRDWYFKNGTYNNGLPAGGKSTAQFRNITHWASSGGGGSTITGFKRLVARHSGRDVVVQSASTSDGANVFQYSYTSATPRNDEWEILSVGSGYYRIMNRHSGKALVVQSASTSSGANVIQWSYTSGNATNDEWAIESLSGGYHRIVNRHSGLVLEVEGAGTSNSVNIRQATWSGGTHQQFQLLGL